MDLVAHASGALTEPALSSFDVAVSKLDATVGGLAVTVSPGARASWQPGRLAVQGLAVSTGASRLTVDGEIDGTPAHQLTMSVDGRLDDFRPLVAQALPDGYDTLVMAGPISGVVRASGALDLPTIAGSLQVTDAEIGDGVHPSATGVTVRATIDREKFEHRGGRSALAGRAPGSRRHGAVTLPARPRRAARRRGQPEGPPRQRDDQGAGAVRRRRGAAGH